MTTREWAAMARARLAPLVATPVDPEFIDELATHLAQTYEEARRDGRSEDESRGAALALLAESSPWIEAARERARRPLVRRVDAWTRQEAPADPGRGGLMSRLGIGRDVRHALRLLVRTPAFTRSPS